jgi:hypothetical protein
MQATDLHLTIEGDNSLGTLNFYHWNKGTEGVYNHVTVNLENGKELNPFGGENNIRENPTAIRVMDLTILKPGDKMINRQLNWSYILFDVRK